MTKVFIVVFTLLHVVFMSTSTMNTTAAREAQTEADRQKCAAALDIPYKYCLFPSSALVIDRRHEWDYDRSGLQLVLDEMYLEQILENEDAQPQ